MGINFVHQIKQLGSMDTAQVEAATVGKVACTTMCTRAIAYSMARPPAPLVHYILQPLLPFSHRATQDSAARYCSEKDPTLAPPGAPPTFLLRSEQTSLIIVMLKQTSFAADSSVNHTGLRTQMFHICRM